jgi:hypothetical protein
MTTSRKDNKEKKRKEVPWVSDCLPKGFPLYLSQVPIRTCLKGPTLLVSIRTEPKEKKPQPSIKVSDKGTATKTGNYNYLIINILVVCTLTHHVFSSILLTMYCHTPNLYGAP